MKTDALAIFDAGVRAVQPVLFMPQYLRREQGRLLLGDAVIPLDSIKRCFLVGAGKAAAAMARETEKILGNLITGGIVISKYGHCLPLRITRCMEAGHPLPDENGVQAATQLTGMLSRLGEEDLVITLVSGGASALLADHPPGIALEEMRTLFSLLLNAGADIVEMNVVRKHVSRLKGGQLAALAQPARLAAFILSDVAGDPLDSIAGGITVGDSSYFADAWLVLEKYRLVSNLPASIRRWLQQGLAGAVPETPKPGDPVFEKTVNILAGTNHAALKAAAAKAAALGYHCITLTETLNGEAREKGAAFARYLLDYRGPRPACLLMGGETTVTVKGNGRGGRNQEFALSALVELQRYGEQHTKFPVILSAGTDGTDGPTDAAGAVIDTEAVQVARQAGKVADNFLEKNDSYHYFQQYGGLVITGPTQTNVMDIVVGLLW